MGPQGAGSGFRRMGGKARFGGAPAACREVWIRVLAGGNSPWREIQIRVGVRVPGLLQVWEGMPGSRRRDPSLRGGDARVLEG